MARLTSKTFDKHLWMLALLCVVSCLSKSPTTSTPPTSATEINSVISGEISNLSAFGLASAEEFRVYALNTEGKQSYSEIDNDGKFSITAPAKSLYLIYVLQDNDNDGSFENLITIFDSIAGGAVDLVPLYSDSLDLGEITLPLGGPGSVLDLASNPAIGNDMDADGILDDVDTDINGNGLEDSEDLVKLDRDSDDIPNPIDSDRDGDTLINAIDPNQYDTDTTPLLFAQDTDGDGIEDTYDIEPFSLSGDLNVHYVSGKITYVPGSEALTAVVITTKGRLVRSPLDDSGNFQVPLQENEAFLLYFMNGNVVPNAQDINEFRGIVDPIAGGAPSLLAIGTSNLNLGELTLPGDPENRALNLSITILANRDSDNDGIADSVDSDRDGNGILDTTEALTLNFDSDKLPNILDDDDDNDSVLDSLDTDRDGDNQPDSIDADGDGIADTSDTDYENDGQLDGSNPTLVEAPDLEAPIKGSNINFPSEYLEPTSLRVSWGIARDNATPTALLEYKAVISTVLNDIDSVNEVNLLAGPNVILDWTANTNTVDITGLTFPQTYYFSVLVRDEVGNMSLYTPQSQATVDDTNPNPGTGLLTTIPSPPGPNNIHVSWGAATDNHTLPGVLEYKLVSASSTAEIDTVNEANSAVDVAMNWTAGATSFNVTGLDELTQYAVAVIVRDEAGNMSLYSPVSATTIDTTPPVVGIGPSFSNLLDTSLSINWEAATDNTSDQNDLQYKILISTDPLGSDIDTVGEADSSANIVTDWTTNITNTNATGLSQGTDYSFAILVRDLSGNMSLYSPQSITTINSDAPDVGTQISFGAITDTTIDLSWGAATDDLTLQALLEYKVVRATNPTFIDSISEADAIVGPDPNLVLDWSVNQLSTTATGLTSGVKYYFNILVKDDAGNIAIYSPEAATTTDIIAPIVGAGAFFANLETTQVDVSWDAATDNLTAQNQLSYKVVRSLNPAFIDETTEANSAPSADFIVIQDWTTNLLAITASELEDAEDHYISVFVRDASMNISIYAPQMISTPDGTAPVITTPDDNIFFSGTTETETIISWGAAADAVTITNDLEYKIVRVTSSSGSTIDTLQEINAITTTPQGLILDWTAASLIGDPLEHTDTGLTFSTQYFYAIAVRDGAGNTSIYTPQTVTTSAPPNLAPVAGTNISFSSTLDTKTNISWGIATDDITAQSSLQYKLVRASSAAAIDTVEEADVATIVRDWTTNSTSFAVTGLTASTSYYFGVLVKDAEGLKTLYPPQNLTTLAHIKTIFVTNSSTKGKFSISTADSTCDSEGKSRINSSKTYKAIISNGNTRTTTTDWTLSANTTYKNKNGDLIGTTTAGKIFSFPLTLAFDSSLASNVYAWTGLNSDWTNASQNCKGWTTSSFYSSGFQYGKAGSPFSTSNTTLSSSSGSSRFCSSTSRLYCAEQ